MFEVIFIKIAYKVVISKPVTVIIQMNNYRSFNIKWKLVIYLMTLASVFIKIADLNGQYKDITPPEKPVITYVTVDTSTNNTIIYWKKSSSKDVETYIIYYEVNTVNGWEGKSIATIAASESSFVHESEGLAGRQSILYSVTAVDTAENESLRSTDGLHSTINLSAVYDSCNSTITLNWNKYKGWEDYLQGGYYLHARWANTDTIIGLSKDTISKVFYRIPENTLFYAFIECIQNREAFVSMSNVIPKFTYMPSPPDDLLLDFVSVTGLNTVDIQFSFSEPTEITDFALLKSIDDSLQRVPDKTFYDILSSPYIIEDSIFTYKEKYFYRIGALNKCNVVIGTSNLASNILLTGVHNEKNSKDTIKWDAYNRFPNGTDSCEMFRHDTAGNLVSLGIIDANDTSYIDDLLNISGQNYVGKITYQIKAFEKNSSNYALSNLCELKVRSNIWLPNAFTPNADSKNDLFFPRLSFLPKTYRFVIYDRSGFAVFESTSPEIKWDGRINGNNFAPEGVYMYHVQCVSYNDGKEEKTGHVTLLYP
jgi:gliding motility-associated-like protein